MEKLWDTRIEQSQKYKFLGDDEQTIVCDGGKQEICEALLLTLTAREKGKNDH